MSQIPDTVTGDQARMLYDACNRTRGAIKALAADVHMLRAAAAPSHGFDTEVVANIMLAYRHLEDSSMRLGKALQAIDGGVSVYDRATTVGA